MTLDTETRGVAAIAQAFERRKKAGQKVLVPYLMMGDPGLAKSADLVRTLAGAGVDLVELGAPFSDPLADGPVIQRAGQRSLAAGTNLPKVLESAAGLRSEGITTPFIVMTYYNVLLRFGLEAVAEEFHRSGVDGLIVVDLPPEESEEFDGILAERDIALVYLAAPTTTDRRLDLVARLARGFLYYVSRTGVTGEQKDVASDLSVNLGRIRERTDIPAVVGFGVSNADQARHVAQYADGVVIGSAIVKIIETSPENKVRENVLQFLQPVLDVLHG